MVRLITASPPPHHRQPALPPPHLTWKEGRIFMRGEIKQREKREKKPSQRAEIKNENSVRLKVNQVKGRKMSVKKKKKEHKNKISLQRLYKSKSKKKNFFCSPSVPLCHYTPVFHLPPSPTLKSRTPLITPSYPYSYTLPPAPLPLSLSPLVLLVPEDSAIRYKVFVRQNA